MEDEENVLNAQDSADTETPGIFLNHDEVQAIVDYMKNQFISWDPRPRNKMYDGEIVHSVLDRMSLFLSEKEQK